MPLPVGHPLASVPHPDRMWLEWQLIRGLWLTQAVVGGWGRKVYGMRGKPVAAVASIKLQQPEVRRVFSRGSCPWITGPWRCVAGCTGSREGRCG